MARLESLMVSDLSERQKQVFLMVPRRRDRSEVTGPGRALILAPEFADKAQAFGLEVQDMPYIEDRLKEIVILTTVRAFDCEYAWHHHAEDAVRFGVLPEVVEAIRMRQPPAFVRDDEAGVYRLTTALLSDHKLSDEAYAAAVGLFGQVVLVQLIGLIGYYVFLGMTLNAFDILPPPGTPFALS